jgi:hypothetical protein
MNPFTIETATGRGFVKRHHLVCPAMAHLEMDKALVEESRGALRYPVRLFDREGRVIRMNEAAVRHDEAVQALARRALKKPKAVDKWMADAALAADHFVVVVPEVKDGRRSYRTIRCNRLEEARGLIKTHGGYGSSITRDGLTVPLP